MTNSYRKIVDKKKRKVMTQRNLTTLARKIKQRSRREALNSQPKEI